MYSYLSFDQWYCPEIETAQALEEPMVEADFTLSRTILECQVQIKDLEHSYSSERDTYIPMHNLSSVYYVSNHQRQLAAHIRTKYMS
ncbi:hypothetical protein I4U23_010690 [Adineta vaga]|nr:hypothetical protein I4U23_010690 [Adineta vaga]